MSIGSMAKFTDKKIIILLLQRTHKNTDYASVTQQTYSLVLSEKNLKIMSSLRFKNLLHIETNIIFMNSSYVCINNQRKAHHFQYRSNEKNLTTDGCVFCTQFIHKYIHKYIYTCINTCIYTLVLTYICMYRYVNKYSVQIHMSLHKEK